MAKRGRGSHRRRAIRTQTVAWIVPTLADAITAVEQANTNYQGAMAQTSNDQAATDAAKAVVSSDQAGQAGRGWRAGGRAAIAGQGCKRSDRFGVAGRPAVRLMAVATRDLCASLA